MRSIDYLIVGAGIVGLSIAKELRVRNPQSKIIGFRERIKNGNSFKWREYCRPSQWHITPQIRSRLKLARKGSLEMVANCKEQNFPINNIGKILVELNIKDATQLDLLKDRAKKNGVLAPHMIRDFIGSKFSKLRFYLYKVLKSITKSINL